MGDVRTFARGFRFRSEYFLASNAAGAVKRGGPDWLRPHRARFTFPGRKQAKQQAGANLGLLVAGAAVWQPTAPRSS